MKIPDPVENVNVTLDVDQDVTYVTVSENAEVPKFVNYNAGDRIPFVTIIFQSGEWKVVAEAGNGFGTKRSLISISDIKEWHYKDDLTVAEKKISEVNKIL